MLIPRGAPGVSEERATATLATHQMQLGLTVVLDDPCRRFGPARGVLLIDSTRRHADNLAEALSYISR